MGCSVPLVLLQTLTVSSAVALIIALLGAVHICTDLYEFSTSVDTKMDEFKVIFKIIILKK